MDQKQIPLIFLGAQVFLKPTTSTSRILSSAADPLLDLALQRVAVQNEILFYSRHQIEFLTLDGNFYPYKPEQLHIHLCKPSI